MQENKINEDITFNSALDKIWIHFRNFAFQTVLKETFNSTRTIFSGLSSQPVQLVPSFGKERRNTAWICNISEANSEELRNMRKI